MKKVTTACVLSFRITSCRRREINCHEMCRLPQRVVINPREHQTLLLYEATYKTHDKEKAILVLTPFHKNTRPLKRGDLLRMYKKTYF
jgi:hypothetical protein